jgi:coenzyme F420-reducing hydrogenase alpha subunit
MPDRTIQVRMLARVEGEGGLLLRFRDGEPVTAILDIYEPPRFFEALLRGRPAAEAPDITARICGICPVAYQMSACQAIESLVGLELEAPLRTLRRLLYCGEWIESHVLHVFMLHAPDFLGFPDVVAMARDHGEWVQRALRMKKAGNALMTVVGGREIHPINVRVGGFHRLPAAAELRALVPELEWGRDTARAALEWASTLAFPALERDYEFVALRHPDEYPMIGGRLVSSRGLDIPVEEYEAHFEEVQVPHSNALHSVRRGGGSYLVGPLARFNLCFDQLGAAARGAALAVGLRPPLCNPFRSLLVRLVETIQAFDEAARIAAAWEAPGAAHQEPEWRAGVGWGCTEAPRGILVHRYRTDAAGGVLEAKIVPPTSQNQRSIESDLLALAPLLADLPEEAATLRAEQAVRNHDPCISCATHFLRLRIERE